MGVYIKGLNKKDISDLRVHKYGGAYEFVEYEDIIEVKTPHGDLIDRDRAISLCVKIILDQVEIKAKVSSRISF